MIPLQGSLPPQWAALSSLSTLALNTNNLTRTLPAAYATMDSLERAYLYSNFLTGARALGGILAARASRHVNWDSCQRFVHCPAGRRRTAHIQCCLKPRYCPWLQSVSRARAGTLPPEYSNLTGLVDLDLHDNLLTGTLPAAYFTATAFSNNTFLEARCREPYA